MLAAESSWRILDAEHHRLRQLLVDIARILDGDAWQRRGPQLDRLRRLAREFQDFEARTHRPKGAVLLGAMRGRLAQADQLLDALEQEGEQCDQLLTRALLLLDALEQGSPANVGEAAALLRQHHALMTCRMEQEDTVLRSYTARLLTPEEWSRVASSISSHVERIKGYRR